MATVRELVRIAARAAEQKKGQDVRAIDVRGISSVTDYMIIATGTSDTHVRAIAEGVREALAAKGERPFSAEGLQEGTWALLDYVDFVVHVFHAEKRVYFGLEELWADAKPVPVGAARTRTASEGAGARGAARPAARSAARETAREAPARAPRAALKPAAKKGPVPKKAGAGKAPAPKKTAVPKRKTTS